MSTNLKSALGQAAHPNLSIPVEGTAKAVAGGKDAPDVETLATDIGNGVAHGRFDLTDAVAHQHSVTLTLGSAAGREGMLTDKSRVAAADTVVQHEIPNDENYEKMFGQQPSRGPGVPNGMR